MRPYAVQRLLPRRRMQVEITDYDVWSFYRIEGGWKWCRRSPDGDLLLEARAVLPTIRACQFDARRFGYTTESAVPG